MILIFHYVVSILIFLFPFFRIGTEEFPVPPISISKKGSIICSLRVNVRKIIVETTILVQLSTSGYIGQKSAILIENFPIKKYVKNQHIAYS